MTLAVTTTAAVIGVSALLGLIYGDRKLARAVARCGEPKAERS